MEQTKIEWTNTYLTEPVLWKKELTKVIPGATFNPWWGCNKVSEGCKHCYAESLSDRRMGLHNWGPDSTRMKFQEKHWNDPVRWDDECRRLGIRRKVFCASMADVFEDHPDVVEERKQLFDLIERTKNLYWLLLTKRPENIMSMVPEAWRQGFPLNVWMGTTTENQQAYDKRVPLLAKVPALVHFLSMEPLLGPIDMHLSLYHRQIDWAIVGGESGAKARPMHPDWALNILWQCSIYKVPFFFKQWGGTNKKAAGRELDGRLYNEMPYNDKPIYNDMRHVHL